MLAVSRGVLAFWSAKPNRKFVKRLRKAAFDVDEIPVRGTTRYRGARHIIWAAIKHEAA